MSAAVYDGGRDSFLERSSSKPPSKFDSIEYLDAAATGKGKSRRITSCAAGGLNNAGPHTCSSDASSPGSNATTAGAWSWRDGNSSIATKSWKEEVSGRRHKPLTAPSSCKYRKKFYWGPRVTHQGQETKRDVRSTNRGEPVTFALCVRSAQQPRKALYLHGPHFDTAHDAHAAHTVGCW